VAESVEQAIYTWLQADSDLTGAFSGMYWMEAESTTYPYLVYWLVDDAGTKTRLHTTEQGEARIQFDIWDSSNIRGVRDRTLVREKVDALSETVDGIMLMTVGVTEQTIPRESDADPYHFVVDGVIRWYK
jgi:hypothetical protein